MIESAWENMHDPVAEDSLAGWAVMDPAITIEKAGHVVSRSEFFNDQHGLVWEACGRFYRAGHSYRVDTGLASGLKASPYLSAVRDACKNVRWLHDDDAAYAMVHKKMWPHPGNAVYYAERVRDMAIARRSCLLLSESAVQLQQTPAEPGTVLDSLVARCTQLRNGMASRGPTEAWQAFVEVIADAESRMNHSGPRVLLSGLPLVDQAGLVFGHGELAVLAARPGVGKTAFAAQVALHHAKNGRGVMIASLEMSAKELAARILYGEACIGSTMRTASCVGEADIKELRDAQARIGRLPLWLWSPGRVSAGQIAAEASLCHAIQGLKLLIVDYIGLVRYEGPHRERYMQVGEVVKQLRDIGQKLQIPVLALCQLSRAADSEEPKLSHLRESGDIEQDADVVAFLHRTGEATVSLICGKNRHGSPGRCDLVWVPEQTKFIDPCDVMRDTAFDEYNNR